MMNELVLDLLCVIYYWNCHLMTRLKAYDTSNIDKIVSEERIGKKIGFRDWNGWKLKWIDMKNNH